MLHQKTRYLPVIPNSSNASANFQSLTHLALLSVKTNVEESIISHLSPFFLSYVSIAMAKLFQLPYKGIFVTFSELSSQGKLML